MTIRIKIYLYLNKMTNRVPYNVFHHLNDNFLYYILNVKNKKVKKNKTKYQLI